MVEAARLMLRVWRLSRRTGIPFEPLMQAHLEMLKLRAEVYEALLMESTLHDIRAEAERQAARN